MRARPRRDDYDDSRRRGSGYDDYDDRRRGGGRYDDRRGGGRYDDRRGGGRYDDHRGGGRYDDRRGGGRYDDRRRGGYDDRRRGGYDDRRGGYDDDRRRGSGYDDRRRDGGEYEDDRRGGGQYNDHHERDTQRSPRDVHPPRGANDNGCEGSEGQQDTADKADKADNTGESKKDSTTEANQTDTTDTTDTTDKANTEDPEYTEPIVLESFETFEEMGLDETIMRGLVGYGFERPSSIQKKAICAFTKYNRDLIAQAQSGTGKTATFSVALLQKIDEDNDDLQGIILVNTQELAAQIHTVITSIGQFTKRRIALVTGGSNIRRSVDELDRQRPHVIVATPGRLLQYLRDRFIDTRQLKYFILDEADQMLSDGFTNEVREVISYLPESAKIGLYSATMPPEMDATARKFMRNPIEIRVKEEEQTLEGIRQYRIDLEREDHRFACLMDIFTEALQSQMMIYCNSKRSVDDLKYRLDNEQIPCEAIHGKMMGNERKAIMRDFRSGAVRVLVTTDLTARGIDVQQVSLVINYEFPHDTAMYLHRIGRSGRFGRKGRAINFVVHDKQCRRFDRKLDRYVSDPDSFRRVVEYYQTQIDEMPADIKSALA